MHWTEVGIAVGIGMVSIWADDLLYAVVAIRKARKRGKAHRLPARARDKVLPTPDWLREIPAPRRTVRAQRWRIGK